MSISYVLIRFYLTICCKGPKVSPLTLRFRRDRRQVFSPPWCDMTDSYCSLQEIPTMSKLPDPFKVRSGPGVSAIIKFQITNHKYQMVRQAHHPEPSRKANHNDRNSKFQTCFSQCIWEVGFSIFNSQFRLTRVRKSPDDRKMTNREGCITPRA